jgi:hypothetical protein
MTISWSIVTVSLDYPDIRGVITQGGVIVTTSVVLNIAHDLLDSDSTRTRRRSMQSVLQRSITSAEGLMLSRGCSDMEA